MRTSSLHERGCDARSAIVAFEIERKFLVKGDAWRGLSEPLRIRQGYVAM